MERKCSFCGDVFNSLANRKTCYSEHIIPCDECGLDFKPNARKLRENVRTCSDCLRIRHSIRMKELTASGKIGFGNKANQAAAKKAIREKYGVDNVSQVAAIQEKKREVFQERYGADSPFEAREIQEKIAETNLLKYGAANPFAAPPVQKKIKATLEERYGVDNALKSPEVKKRWMQSMKSNYGEKQKTKRKETNLIRYNLDNVAKILEVREKARELRLLVSDSEFTKLIKELASDSITKKISPELLRDSLGYESLSPVYKRIRRLGLEEYIQYKGDSMVNIRWKKRLENSLGVSLKTEGSIFTDKRWKSDFYHEESKIAIDINPTISHSTQQAHPFYTPKAGRYHQMRALDAEANGWTLYQIYDWTDEEQAISQLKNLLKLNTERYNARSCVIVRPEKKAIQDFLEAQHLQGAASVGSIYFGLEHAGELVQVMTFSKARFRGALAEYELIRLASKGSVRGGASRLFKAFVNEYAPTSVQTYASLDNGHGRVYEMLKFRYHSLSALNGLYAKPGTKEAYKVTTCSKKFGKEYHALGLSQQEFMNQKGFYRINDAGNKIFIWHKEKVL